uniref:Armadillo repeat-containing protein 8 n=1 Tax=Panagrolaimus davidi TaxID=227884 RepID=A0A914PKE3_9BILA
MMVGDAELPVIHENVQLQNNRILNSLNHLKTNEELLLRRRAAEIFSNSVAFASDIDENLQMKIVKGIYKIMKKYDEDSIVLSHILTLLKNLAEKRSALVHLLLPMNITKLLAYHARYSSFHEIRDLSVQILGEFASCCFECQKSVAKTTASVTILEVLEKNLDTLTLNQQLIYSRALTNIFCETFDHSEAINIFVGVK